MTVNTILRFVSLIFALSLFALPSVSSATSRHALIIGNSQYSGGFELDNPRRDATAIADSLESLGYKIHRGNPQFDLQLDAFNNTIDEFLASVEDGSSTLVFYAGHGAASSGANYLIPILPAGVTLRSESDIRDRSISLQSILDRLESRNPSGVNVLFYDACRDAPVDNFSRSINLSGLVPLDTGRQPRGSFVGFSTEYGDVALDDDESGHSPFASAILNSLDDHATAPIELFYKSVVDQVYDSTSGQQFPIQESKIRGQHCIIQCEAVTAQSRPREFGQLSVETTPLDATVCYLIEGWTQPNCGPQMVLPIGKDVQITVNAKGHQPYRTVTRITDSRQQLRVALDQNNNNTLKIIGGVAVAILVTGLLLSGDKSEGSGEEEFTVTLIRP